MSKNINEVNRNPGTKVIRELRQEVGFSCPVVDPRGIRCGNPYLTWHHFDPPWNVEPHQNPRGMIALCRKHHDKADAGTYTKKQLHNFKKQARNRTVVIKEQFDWMRDDLLVVAGGNFHYKTPIAVQYHESPIIWFERDEQGFFY